MRTDPPSSTPDLSRSTTKSADSRVRTHHRLQHSLVPRPSRSGTRPFLPALKDPSRSWFAGFTENPYLKTAWPTGRLLFRDIEAFHFVEIEEPVEEPLNAAAFVRAGGLFKSSFPDGRDLELNRFCLHGFLSFKNPCLF